MTAGAPLEPARAPSQGRQPGRGTRDTRDTRGPRQAGCAATHLPPSSRHSTAASPGAGATSGRFASFLLGNRNWESEGGGVGTEKGRHAGLQPGLSGGAGGTSVPHTVRRPSALPVTRGLGGPWASGSCQVSVREQPTFGTASVPEPGEAVAGAPAPTRPRGREPSHAEKSRPQPQPLLRGGAPAERARAPPGTRVPRCS